MVSHFRCSILTASSTSAARWVLAYVFFAGIVHVEGILYVRQQTDSFVDGIVKLFTYFFAEVIVMLVAYLYVDGIIYYVNRGCGCRLPGAGWRRR